ncbi:type II toxin-antitoxin system RelB/DinJ family antitoxin [Ancylobacter sp. IITR112]|uniref:type II toxin-antitoxin system RelB/DinJ family antitoxin n=1 Tax=Ancylobacter sp. IITR112 TaxID=3138073 RepID=UPI00352B48EE
MAQTSMIHIRIDDETKERATQAVQAMGLSLSDAVRLFLHRVVADQALPFAVRVPNAETQAALREADEIVAARRARFSTADALFDDIEANAGK